MEDVKALSSCLCELQPLRERTKGHKERVLQYLSKKPGEAVTYEGRSFVAKPAVKKKKRLTLSMIQSVAHSSLDDQQRASFLSALEAARQCGAHSQRLRLVVKQL